ncbi:hypothetical protein ABID58_007265 [Bradyrhizobium sp. S3.2.6]
MAWQCGVEHACVVNRTNQHALRFVKVAVALGALLRIDQENAGYFGNSKIWALRFAR